MGPEQGEKGVEAGRGQSVEGRAGEKGPGLKEEHRQSLGCGHVPSSSLPPPPAPAPPRPAPAPRPLPPAPPASPPARAVQRSIAIDCP